MNLPNSFANEGFLSPDRVRLVHKMPNGQYLKGILIGCDGPSDSGKTEFALSAPGPIQVIAVDRNFQGVLDNTEPPATRAKTYAFKVIKVPGAHPTVKSDPKIFEPYHVEIRDSFYKALRNPDSPTVILDGDSDWWEIHNMAHFGKLTQIYPQTKYAAPKAEKRAIVATAFDSGKIVILTNKSRAEYAPVFKPDGTPVMDDYTNEQKREPTGKLESQGFTDRDYLVQIWLHHMYKAPHQRKIGTRMVDVPASWGVRLTKCKHNPALVGAELWGESCCFKGLMELVYPEIPTNRWGW